MKYLGVAIVVAVLASGCVVAPHHGPVRGAVRISAPMYPTADAAYIWDAELNLFFFWHNHQRYYMPRSWDRSHLVHPRYRGTYMGHYDRGHWHHH